jgi:serine/threonine protein kinase
VTPTYKVIELLGKGSYGHVYKIKHRTTKKYFAMKYIKGIFTHESMAKSTLLELDIQI